MPQFFLKNNLRKAWYKSAASLPTNTTNPNFVKIVVPSYELRYNHAAVRRGARAVEWDGLENRCGLRATVGSNPTLSAIFAILQVSEKVREKCPLKRAFFFSIPFPLSCRLILSTVPVRHG
jgi:hypothetical protein